MSNQCVKFYIIISLWFYGSLKISKIP